MSEDDIRNFLNRREQESKLKAPLTVPPRRRAPRRRTPQPEAKESFQNFSATELYCPKCKQAMPVREKLLLVLPDGDLFDYSCTGCGTSTGTRKAGP